MAEYHGRLSRRAFLATALAAATTRTAHKHAAAAEPGIVVPPIPTLPFGCTGRRLPILGMGSSPLVSRWSTGYGAKQSTIEDRAALVRRAYDRGVRYFDTARSYFEAEEVIGKGLKGVAHGCFIATKVTVLDPTQVRASVEKSLQVLDVDRVDTVQIHSSGTIEHGGFEPSMKIHAELVKLRDEGLLRFIGLTTHVAFETVYKLIATGGFDQALLTISYFHKGMNTLLSADNRAWREKCLDKAHDLGMGVVAMKVMGVSVFGRTSKSVVAAYDPTQRAKLPAAAMRWVLDDERVSLLAIGMGYAEEIEQNAAVLASDFALTDEDRRLLADYSAKAYQSPRIKALGVDQDPRSPEAIAEAVVAQFDQNQDGKVSRREVPERLRQRFEACDGDKDGFVTSEELIRALRTTSNR